ncbi:hypothetical protein [Paenibacillus agricola]|nr:hypothetical protein [Paenibacillus agricola]
MNIVRLCSPLGSDDDIADEAFQLMLGLDPLFMVPTVCSRND